MAQLPVLSRVKLATAGEEVLPAADAPLPASPDGSWRSTKGAKSLLDMVIVTASPVEPSNEKISRALNPKAEQLASRKPWMVSPHTRVLPKHGVGDEAALAATG